MFSVIHDDAYMYTIFMQMPSDDEAGLPLLPLAI